MSTTLLKRSHSTDKWIKVKSSWNSNFRHLRFHLNNNYGTSRLGRLEQNQSNFRNRDMKNHSTNSKERSRKRSVNECMRNIYKRKYRSNSLPILKMFIQKDDIQHFQRTTISKDIVKVQKRRLWYFLKSRAWRRTTNDGRREGERRMADNVNKNNGRKRRKLSTFLCVFVNGRNRMCFCPRALIN